MQSENFVIFHGARHFDFSTNAHYIHIRKTSVYRCPQLPKRKKWNKVTPSPIFNNRNFSIMLFKRNSRVPNTIQIAGSCLAISIFICHIRSGAIVECYPDNIVHLYELFLLVDVAVICYDLLLFKKKRIKE